MQDPDNVEAEEAHVCKTCFKSYQRRDLFLRHQRRCSRPKKILNRRKACDVCVQAKTKCDYTQPTCTRCAKRDISCHYVVSSNTTDLNENILDDANRRASLETNGTEAADMDYSSVSTSSPAGNSANPFEVTPSWSLQVPSWPLPFDDIENTFQSSTFPDTSGFAAIDSIFGIADPNNSGPISASQQFSSSSMSTLLPNTDGLIPPSAEISGMTSGTSLASVGDLDINSASLHTPRVSPYNHWTSVYAHEQYPSLLVSEDSSSRVASLGGLDINSASLHAPKISLYNPWTSVYVLGQYPSLLLSDDFSSPLIHRIMYNEHVSDMTTLPRTSMAICCGSSNDSSQYVKRAIDAERRSLIQEFPTYKCMQQWDALHAMLVYEILELQEAYKYSSDSSKQKPRVKGLQLPFILKMTQCFSKSYPEIHNPDQHLFLDNAAGMNSPGKSPWNKWMITETARRTKFLAYVVNFLCNRDLESGKQSPYYEPLDDDLIMNMPLPCSHALWSARTEDEWTRLMMQQREPAALASDAVFEFDPSLPESASLGSSRPTVRSILSKVTKDSLRTDACKRVGFGDSDELRHFFILCVLEQDISGKLKQCMELTIAHLNEDYFDAKVLASKNLEHSWCPTV